MAAQSNRTGVQRSVGDLGCVKSSERATAIPGRAEARRKGFSQATTGAASTARGIGTLNICVLCVYLSVF